MSEVSKLESRIFQKLNLTMLQISSDAQSSIRSGDVKHSLQLVVSMNLLGTVVDNIESMKNEPLEVYISFLKECEHLCEEINYEITNRLSESSTGG